MSIEHGDQHNEPQLQLPGKDQDGQGQAPCAGHLVLAAEEGLDISHLQRITKGKHFGNTTLGPGRWLERFSGPIRSRYQAVTIVMPNTEEGRRGAEVRAESLSNMGCEVRVVRWEGQPEGHGILQELELRGPEGLHKVIQNAEPYDLVSLHLLRPEEVTWLWDKYIPLGKLTGLQGDPDVGKTYLMCEISAKVSSGEPLYGETSRREPSKVLIVSEEDGKGDTLVPRLKAASARLENIKMPKVHLDLSSEEGRARLERWIHHERPKVVFVDTIDNHTGGKTNPNISSDVRDITRPLCSLASKYGCAIVLIRHMRKDPSGGPIHRGAGSMAWTGACRVVLYAGIKTEAERALFQIKNNLAKKAEPIGYCIEGGRLIWTGKTTLQPHEVGVSATIGDSLVEEAEEFLRVTLAGGEASQEEVEAAALVDGHSTRTLRRAKKSLGIKSFKKGPKWFWSLPSKEHGQPSQPDLATLREACPGSSVTEGAT